MEVNWNGEKLTHQLPNYLYYNNYERKAWETQK